MYDFECIVFCIKGYFLDVVNMWLRDFVEDIGVIILIVVVFLSVLFL